MNCYAFRPTSFVLNYRCDSGVNKMFRFVWLFIGLICSLFFSQVSCERFFPISSCFGSLQATWRILVLLREKSAMSCWLSSVKSMLPVTTHVPGPVFLLLAYLLVQESGASLHGILAAATEVAKADSSQVRQTLIAD